jgi:hypothetical protein
MSAPARPVRALFVIDNDFGALATVMYLLHGQADLCARSTILLPERAHGLHGGHMPMPSRAYRSTQDILDIVDEASPDVVCLFSGHVLALQGVLKISALRELVRELRRRGKKVATSDPFLGTFQWITEAEVPAGPTIPRWLDRIVGRIPRLRGRVAGLTHRLARKRLAIHVRRIASILDDVTHIYPVPVDGLAAHNRGTRVSFFNPRYLRDGEEPRAGTGGGTPRWLFVLAQFDLEFQERRHGKKGFAELVAAMIRETIAAGRRATFIGPAAVTDALSAEFGGNPAVVLLPYCAYDEFERWLLDAEFAFYWQIFSTSSFLRLWNGLPVFFFDCGHNARLLRPLEAVGLRYYYLGDRPVFVDADAPLDAAVLAASSERFLRSAQESRRRLMSVASPDEMLSAILESP